MGEKEREEKFFQGIHSENGLQTLVGAKKVDGRATTFTVKKKNKYVIQKTLDKRFTVPMDFNFFKHPVHSY